MTWKVEREDNYGDQSTTTRLSLIFVAHWSVEFKITRGWADEDDE